MNASRHAPHPSARIGDSLAEIETPALCLDLDRFERNIAAAGRLLAGKGIDWRPHAKCHKSPAIAQKLIEAGAIGATCAKLGEAEILAAAGVRDLLIANLIVGGRKIERLVALRRRADPIVCLDAIEQALPISAAMSAAGLTLRVLIEIDIGMARVGVAPGETVLELARKLRELPGIELAGVMGYEGHALLIADPSEKAAAVATATGKLTDARDLLEANGIACPIVSCGGTGSLAYTAEQPGVTEIQAGGLIFMDAFYRHSCRVAEFEYALFIVATVVSRPEPDRAIIDAGRKTMNQELHMPLVVDYLENERPGIEIAYLSAEHGVLKLAKESAPLAIGDRLTIVPGYGDFTTVLHDYLIGVRNGRVETIYPIEARGALT
jgi:D-serine deaminase-like pyridoxal phosphate-dependent protein